MHEPAARHGRAMEPSSSRCRQGLAPREDASRRPSGVARERADGGRFARTSPSPRATRPRHASQPRTRPRAHRPARPVATSIRRPPPHAASALLTSTHGQRRTPQRATRRRVRPSSFAPVATSHGCVTVCSNIKGRRSTDAPIPAEAPARANADARRPVANRQPRRPRRCVGASVGRQGANDNGAGSATRRRAFLALRRGLCRSLVRHVAAHAAARTPHQNAQPTPIAHSPARAPAVSRTNDVDGGAA